MTKKHIDYEAESKRRVDYLNLTGGLATESLTVRDVFAVEVLAALIATYQDHYEMDTKIVPRAYEIADRMLKQREIYDANN